MPVTLGDVATAAGMSIPAVSQILNGKGSYREETRTRVFAVARRLGYQPNIYAQAMTRRRFGAYALVLSSNPSSSLLPRGLLEGFDAVLGPAGIHLVMAFLPDHELTDAASAPKILTHVVADGLLINYNAGYPRSAVRLLEEKDVPSVWMNVDHAENAVHPDDHGAGLAMARRLQAQGHTRLAWYDHHLAPGAAGIHYSAQARRDGFLAAAPGARILGLPDRAGGAERIAYLRATLSAPDRPTAIGCYGPKDAELLVVTATQLGLRIPQDLSLMAVSDRSLDIAGLEIDCLVIDSQSLARAAADMLALLVDGKDRQASVAIPMHQAAGASIAPPGSVTQGRPG